MAIRRAMRMFVSLKHNNFQWKGATRQLVPMKGVVSSAAGSSSSLLSLTLLPMSG